MEETLSNEPIYEWHEGAENLDGYRPGGYSPTHIRDLYSNRGYDIVHKLRSGSYSTVCLVRDLRLNRYVALKIVIAGTSKESLESRVLRYLHQRVGGACDTMITSFKDEFYINGPNGRHVCLTIEPQRVALQTLKKPAGSGCSRSILPE